MVSEHKDIIFFLKSLLHHLISSPTSVFLPPPLAQPPNSNSRSPSLLKIPRSTSTLIGYVISGIVSLQWTQTCLSHMPYPKLNVFYGYTSLINAHTTLYVPATNVCQHPPVTTFSVSFTCITSTLCNGCHDSVCDVPPVLLFFWFPFVSLFVFVYWKVILMIINNNIILHQLISKNHRRAIRWRNDYSTLVDLFRRNESAVTPHLQALAHWPALRYTKHGIDTHDQLLRCRNTPYLSRKILTV